MSHKKQHNCHLLFSNALNLGDQLDLEEVMGDCQIDQEKYNAFYERRLLPILKHASDHAKSKGKKAIVALPAMGCSVFSGRFDKEVVQNHFQIAVKEIINSLLPLRCEIALVQMQELEFVDQEVDGIKFRGDGTVMGLSKPEDW